MLPKENWICFCYNEPLAIMLNKKKPWNIVLYNNVANAAAFQLNERVKASFRSFHFSLIRFPISINLGPMLFLECIDSDMLSKIKHLFFSFSCGPATSVTVMYITARTVNKQNFDC